MTDTSAPSDSSASEVSLAAPSAEAPAPSYAGTKHKVKIDDQELEVPYEQLVSDYQLSTASRKRFEQASKLKKEVDSFIGSLKSGDLKQLKQIIPADQLRKFAEDELMDFVKYEQMTDEQKEALAAKQERDALKAEKEELEREKKESYRAHIEQQTIRELDLEIGQAIKELRSSENIDASAPVDAWFIKHVVDVMLAHLESSDDETAPRMSAKDATNYAWKGFGKNVMSYLESLPEDKAIAAIPRKLRDSIRKADVKDAVTQLHTSNRSKHEDGESSRKRQEKPSVEDYFSLREKRFGG